MKSIILGIDPGLRYTGYAILEISDNIKLLNCGCINTEPKQKRLKIIYEVLLDICKNYKPNVMIVEKTYVNINAQTSLGLVSGRTIPLLLAELLDIECIELAPCQIKKYITGNGHAKKHELKSYIHDIFEIPPVNDDIIDAICIALSWKNYITSI